MSDRLDFGGGGDAGGGGNVIIVKRINTGEHEHHGGAWKVAYADCVTAMMAFSCCCGCSTRSQRNNSTVFPTTLRLLQHPTAKVADDPGALKTDGSALYC